MDASTGGLYEELPLADVRSLVDAVREVLEACTPDLCGRPLVAEWRKLARCLALRYNPGVQPRALLVFGCLPPPVIQGVEGVESTAMCVDGDVRHVLALFVQAVKRREQASLIGALLVALSKLHIRLPPVGSMPVVEYLTSCFNSYFSRLLQTSDAHAVLFWTGIIVLQLENAQLYEQALGLIESSLTTLHANGAFQHETVEKVLMDIRRPLEWEFKVLDQHVGLSFRHHFHFAFVGYLLKGLRTDSPAAARKHTLRVLTLMLTLNGASSESTPNTVGCSKWTAPSPSHLRFEVRAETVAYLLALVPFLDEVRRRCRLRSRNTEFDFSRCGSNDTLTARPPHRPDGSLPGAADNADARKCFVPVELSYSPRAAVGAHATGPSVRIPTGSMTADMVGDWRTRRPAGRARRLNRAATVQLASQQVRAQHDAAADEDIFVNLLPSEMHVPPQHRLAPAPLGRKKLAARRTQSTPLQQDTLQGDEKEQVDRAAKVVDTVGQTEGNGVTSTDRSSAQPATELGTPESARQQTGTDKMKPTAIGAMGHFRPPKISISDQETTGSTAGDSSSTLAATPSADQIFILESQHRRSASGGGGMCSSSLAGACGGAGLLTSPHGRFSGASATHRTNLLLDPTVLARHDTQMLAITLLATLARNTTEEREMRVLFECLAEAADRFAAALPIAFPLLDQRMAQLLSQCHETRLLAAVLHIVDGAASAGTLIGQQHLPLGAQANAQHPHDMLGEDGSNRLSSGESQRQHLTDLQAYGFGGLWRFAGPFLSQAASQQAMTAEVCACLERLVGTLGAAPPTTPPPRLPPSPLVPQMQLPGDVVAAAADGGAASAAQPKAFT